jgi:hypothetical protein
MSSAYYPKDDSVYRRSVEVQRLSIPFLITHNATPASKVLSVDEPSLLFLGVQGINNLTVASGAFDTSAEQSAITFASATDTTGIFSILCRINEPLVKVMSVTIVARDGSSSVPGTSPTGASGTFITSLGNKIVANFSGAVNLATTDGNYTLVVEYIAHQ